MVTDAHITCRNSEIKLMDSGKAVQSIPVVTIRSFLTDVLEKKGCTLQTNLFIGRRKRKDILHSISRFPVTI